MTKTTKFFATLNVNGLISHALTAQTLPEAKTELAEAIRSHAAQDWIDCIHTDLEDSLGLSLDGTDRADDVLQAAQEAGAELVLATAEDDRWNIWSVQSAQ